MKKCQLLAKVGNHLLVTKAEVSLEAPPSCGPDGGVSPNSDPDGEASPSSGEASVRGVVSQSGATNGPSFTDEEGYDLFVDANYVQWLKMHHHAITWGAGTERITCACGRWFTSG